MLLKKNGKGKDFWMNLSGRTWNDRHFPRFGASLSQRGVARFLRSSPFQVGAPEIVVGDRGKRANTPVVCWGVPAGFHVAVPVCVVEAFGSR